MSEEQKDSTAPATSEAPKPAEEHKVIPGSIRYTALLLSCFFAFGGYLVFDLCSALKDQMTAEFHLSDTQYSLFYVVYAWTNWFVSKNISLSLSLSLSQETNSWNGIQH